MAEFKDKRTERLFNGERDRGFPPNLRIRAKATLMRVASAQDLADLRIPRSLRLEALGGDRDGTWSVRINRQWRVCFRMTENGATDIEVVDYH